MSSPIHFLALTAGVATLAASAGQASAQSRYDRPYADRPSNDRPYDDRAYGDRADGERIGGLVGPGVELLLPELRDTPRGRAFVRRDFDFNRDGVVQPGEARAADRAFEDRGFGRDRRDHDRYDDRYDDPPPPPPPERRDEGGYGYDRPAMHAYGFRQNRYGAVFTLPDVLFETGSARLRPTADAKLRPLAGYLGRNPGQRLRIDGYTDSVGTAQANLVLSRDRARSVADALAATGIDPGRFQLEGHGEDSPAAANTTAEGRQLNRRVEVTLLGRQASSF